MREDLSSLCSEISMGKTIDFVVFTVKRTVYSAFISKRSIAIPFKTFF